MYIVKYIFCSPVFGTRAEKLHLLICNQPLCPMFFDIISELLLWMVWNDSRSIYILNISFVSTDNLLCSCLRFSLWIGLYAKTLYLLKLLWQYFLKLNIRGNHSSGLHRYWVHQAHMFLKLSHETWNTDFLWNRCCLELHCYQDLTSGIVCVCVLMCAHTCIHKISTGSQSINDLCLWITKPWFVQIHLSPYFSFSILKMSVTIMITMYITIRMHWEAYFIFVNYFQMQLFSCFK